MATAPNPIPALGTPPSADDVSNFDARADDLLGDLPGVVTAMNAAGTVTFNNATEAFNSALDAASAAASAAAANANVAALSSFKGNWSAQAGAMAKPASVFHNGAFWMLLNDLANVAASQPGVTADWQVVGGAWPLQFINTNTTAQPWKTYVFTGACTLTAPAITGNGQQFGIDVLPGVVGAVFAPAGADKTRGASGSQPIDAPFKATLTDSGAAYGWV